jgi:hypothetical protein
MNLVIASSTFEIDQEVFETLRAEIASTFFQRYSY